MARKIWEFKLENKNHKVELTHNYWSSKREIFVDGKKVEMENWDAKPLIDTGSDHEFKIGKHTLTAVIRTNMITYNFDLLIDGISQKTGKEFKGTKKSHNDRRFYWGTIDTPELAEKILKVNSITIAVATGVSALLMTFLGTNIAWVDAIGVSLLCLLLYKKRSIIAGIILMIYTGGNVLMTFSNSVAVTAEGGTNVILAVMVCYLAVRCFQAARFFQKNKKVALAPKKI